MNRSYTLLDIKHVDDDARTITGIATSPATDRMDDIVESRGAVFRLPIPLLWQHDPAKPIGNVISAKVTDAGIEIVAKIAKISEAGTLKEFIDHAWSSIRAGLVRGLSIGFKGLSQEPIHGTYGTRFKKWLWLELSAVTIPANDEATILSVKRYDFGASADVIIDPLAVRLADLDREIERLQRLHRQKTQVCEADQAKHITGQDLDLQARLSAEVKDLEAQISKHRDARFDVELNGVLEPVEKQANSSPGQASAPTGVFITDDSMEDRADEIYSRTVENIPDDVLDSPMNWKDAIRLVAIATASTLDKLDDALERIDAFESCVVVGAKYLGVWQRQQRYKAGSLATFKGSLWHANFDSMGTEPMGPTWTLCARTSEVPLPQRDTAGKRIAGPRLNRKGEKITVTAHDEQGRILAFEKEPIDQ